MSAEGDRAGVARHAVRQWAAFPAVVLLCMVMLIALNVSGSSIALLSDEPSDPGLIAGTPRSIRSDEWWLRTPIAISSVKQNFPEEPWIGLSQIDQQAAAHGGPTQEWSALLKPQDWGYLLLGESRGLATSWWWSFAVGLIGCFAFLGLLTRRPLLSALLSVSAVFTPYTAWWTSPPPALFLGYAALAGASILAAWHCTQRRYQVAFAIAAGLSGTALALALYPPWLVSLGLVVMATCFGHAVDARIGWRRFLWPLLTAGASGGLLLSIWFLQHRSAITAQLATFYPGHRISKAGTASLPGLVDAPLNYWMTGETGATLGHTGQASTVANLSEAASTWLPLPVALLVVLGGIELSWRAYRYRSTAMGARNVQHSTAKMASRSVDQIESAESSHAIPTWTLGALSAAIGLLVAWALLDLPSFVGRVTLLQRVEPTRTPLALGFGLILLVAVATGVSVRQPVAWRLPCLGLAAVASMALTLWADARLPWVSAMTPTWLVAVSGLAVGGAMAAIIHRRMRLMASAALALYALTSWVLVNPLQRGIEPVARDPLVRRLETVTSGTTNPRVAVFAAFPINFATVAKVRAAGLQSLTGTTLYPNASLMRTLVPDQRALWNNFAYYIWTIVPPGTPPKITQIQGTLMSLALPICHPVLLSAADPGWVVSDRKLKAKCLRSVSVVRQAPSSKLWIYRSVS